jgi:hypothetical protein
VKWRRNQRNDSLNDGAGTSPGSSTMVVLRGRRWSVYCRFLESPRPGMLRYPRNALPGFFLLETRALSDVRHMGLRGGRDMGSEGGDEQDRDGVS